MTINSGITYLSKKKRMEFVTQPFKINDILGWFQRKELILSPKFQRRPVWGPKGKSNLIDSIVRGFPLPPFFIREKIDPPTRSTIREVIDGQQRIRAILGFIGEEFTMQKIHNEEYAKIKFNSLPDDTQIKFLSYVLTINVVGQISDKNVYEMFSRLNSYSVPLNNPEKANALYTGVFKQKIDELAKTYLSFWQQCGIFTENNISRMHEIQLTAELIALMMYGLQDGKKIIYNKQNGLYKRFDDEFPSDGDEYIDRFSNIIRYIIIIFGEDLKNTEFKRPPLFYSIFSALYDILYGLPPARHDTPENDSPPSFNDEALDRVKEELINISDVMKYGGIPIYPEGDEEYEADEESQLSLSGEIVMVSGDVPEKYVDFINASSSSTDKINQRQVRHDILKDILSVCFQ